MSGPICMHGALASLLGAALLCVALAQDGAPGTGFFLTDAAKNKGAVCLDGSPSAYYLSPGSGAGADKWYIHMQGGGWCRSLKDCLGRSTTDLGSSKGYSANKTGAEMETQSGAMSRDPTNNPQVRQTSIGASVACYLCLWGSKHLLCVCGEGWFLI